MTEPSEAERYDDARRSLASTLRGLFDPAASPLEAAWHGTAETLARQPETPTPFASRPPSASPPQGLCHEARFGWVHYVGCACRR